MKYKIKDALQEIEAFIVKDIGSHNPLSATSVQRQNLRKLAAYLWVSQTFPMAVKHSSKGV